LHQAGDLFELNVKLRCQKLNETGIFSLQISKNIKKSNFVKIRSVGAEFHVTDGQTDMTKLTVTFRKSENAPKKDVKTRAVKLYSGLSKRHNSADCAGPCQSVTTSQAASTILAVTTNRARKTRIHKSPAYL